MTPESAGGLCCPVCGGAFMPLPGVLRCAAGHSFDLAREGYANLLTVQKKHAADPGDSKEMVAARHSFLSTPAYAPFRQELARLAVAHALPGVHVADAGCGEGSYSAAVWAALEQAGLSPALVGWDLSRPAVRLAAKGLPQGAFCVAGSFAAPVRTGWANLLLNVFSPMAREEFLRVLAPGGCLIYAVPTARHLFGLKAVLYDTPYENTEQDVAYPGFSVLEQTRAEAQITVPAAQVQNLFAMTPYYWKTPREGAARLAALPALETEIGFRFVVYQKQ